MSLSPTKEGIIIHTLRNPSERKVILGRFPFTCLDLSDSQRKIKKIRIYFVDALWQVCENMHSFSVFNWVHHFQFVTSAANLSGGKEDTGNRKRLQLRWSMSHGKDIVTSGSILGDCETANLKVRELTCGLLSYRTYQATSAIHEI